MDRTKLRDEWAKAIGLDPAGSPDEVRAAAALFIMLGRVYIWPIKHYDQDLERAIAALEGVPGCSEYQEAPDLVAQIQLEIEELKSRRKPRAPRQPIVQEASTRPWWKIW